MFAIEARALIFVYAYIMQVLLMRINGLLCNLKNIVRFMRDLTKTKKIAHDRYLQSRWRTCQVLTYNSKRTISQQLLVISHVYTKRSNFIMILNQ